MFIVFQRTALGFSMELDNMFIIRNWSIFMGQESWNGVGGSGGQITINLYRGQIEITLNLYRGQKEII